MWKTVMAGGTALAIAGATLAYAQQGPGRGPDGPRWRPSAEDVSAFGDARIAALKAGLRLTAAQEKNWPPLEAALKSFAKERGERFAARASADRPSDPIQRMHLRAEMMVQTGTSMKAIADGAGPLYQSLDDSQKQRFRVLARMAEGPGFGGPGRGEHRGWRMHHDGFGRGEHGMGGRGFGGGPDGGPDGQPPR